MSTQLIWTPEAAQAYDTYIQALLKQLNDKAGAVVVRATQLAHEASQGQLTIDHWNQARAAVEAEAQRVKIPAGGAPVSYRHEWL